VKQGQFEYCSIRCTPYLELGHNSKQCRCVWSILKESSTQFKTVASLQSIVYWSRYNARKKRRKGKIYSFISSYYYSKSFGDMEREGTEREIIKNLQEFALSRKVLPESIMHFKEVNPRSNHAWVNCC
jgi:hypothetical protein